MGCARKHADPAGSMSPLGIYALYTPIFSPHFPILPRPAPSTTTMTGGCYTLSKGYNWNSLEMDYNWVGMDIAVFTYCNPGCMEHDEYRVTLVATTLLL